MLDRTVELADHAVGRDHDAGAVVHIVDTGWIRARVELEAPTIGHHQPYPVLPAPHRPGGELLVVAPPVGRAHDHVGAFQRQDPRPVHQVRVSADDRPDISEGRGYDLEGYVSPLVP